MRWLDAWRDQFASHRVILTLEGDDWNTAKRDLPCWCEPWTAQDRREAWGDDANILSVKNSGHRCFGLWRAMKRGCDMVVTLDDDCYPEDAEYLDKHWQALTRLGVVTDWVTSIPRGVAPQDYYPRGFPYDIRSGARVVLNHGLWSGVPDSDGVTQQKTPDLRLPKCYVSRSIPSGAFFPMSGMNFACRPDAVPLLYFPKNGEGSPFDRFEDIWAGVLFKRCADVLGWAVTTGSPSVRHERMSDTAANIRKEATGLAENERFWRVVLNATVDGATARDVYASLADEIAQGPSDYYRMIGDYMRRWLTWCSE
jgi:hypothetical protein